MSVQTTVPPRPAVDAPPPIGERSRAALRNNGSMWSRLTAAEREERVANMVLTGYATREIAVALSTTVQAVLKAAKRVQERWQERAVETLDVHIALQLAKLDRLEAEYWDAWRRSCTTNEVRTSRSHKRPGRSFIAPDGSVVAGSPVEHTDAELRTEGRDGNPAFLAGVERCIDQRNRLLGLYTQKLDVNVGFTLDDAYAAASAAIDANATRRDDALARNRAVPLIEGDIDEAMREGDLTDEEVELLAPPEDLVAELEAEAASAGSGVATPDDEAISTEVA